MQQLPGKSELKINGEWIYTENKFELRITILDLTYLHQNHMGQFRQLQNFFEKFITEINLKCNNCLKKSRKNSTYFCFGISCYFQDLEWSSKCYLRDLASTGRKIF